MSFNVKLELRNPTVSEFEKLRASTGWDKLSSSSIKTALNNSLFSVCLMNRNEIIGMGRVIGDAAIYFYIQDVIILPEFQKQGFGDLIMQELMKYIKENAGNNAFIGLMAAEGVERFYHKYDFITRPHSRPGMYLIHKSK